MTPEKIGFGHPEESSILKVPLFILLVMLLIPSQPQLQCDSTVCQCENNICESCLVNGFYYDADSKQCELCPTECSACIDRNICTQCEDSFYLNQETSTCAACDQKYCQSCSKNSNSTAQLTTCTQCISGYTLFQSSTNSSASTECLPCQIPFVSTCESLMTVKTCQNGYWRNGDSCSACRQFCELCTSSNNCLQCQDGYRSRISAGTYCIACDIGCRSCTQNACLDCFFNYRLVNGICMSIESECTVKYNSTCHQCKYINNTVQCVLCQWPYFLEYSNDTSMTICSRQSSSYLCQYGIGSTPYECLNECSSQAYEKEDTTLSGSSSSTNVLSKIGGGTSSTNQLRQIICLPRRWIEGTDIEQLYLNSEISSKDIVDKTIGESHYEKIVEMCSDQRPARYFYKDTFVQGENSFIINSIFEPYYKLIIHVRFLPLFTSTMPSAELILSVKMSDNASNQYTYSSYPPYNYSEQLDASSSSGSIECNTEEQHLTVSSRNIKDQSVQIEFVSRIELSSSSSSSFSDLQYQSTFPNGLVGYREILIEIYRCDDTCRICSNSKYCLECYSEWFQSQNQCVSSCQGLFQFYLPDGDYQNYTSKYCVQQCEDGYYSTVHPLANSDSNSTFICLPCPEKCLTCRSVDECLSCQPPYLYYSNNFSCIEACPNTHYSITRSVSVSSSSAISGNSGVATQQQLFQCSPCNSPCKTCSNSTQCLSCFIGYFYNNSCLGTCPDGTYSASISVINTDASTVSSSNECLACDETCTRCSNSLTFCSSCAIGYKLLGSRCLASCPANTHYELTVTTTNTSSSSNIICSGCKSPCILCTSQTSCLSCSRGYLLPSTSECLSECPSGYYKDIANRQCEPCQNNCETCLSLSICQTCIDQTYLYNSLCLAQCPIKTYTDTTLNICIPCLPPCLTCLNSTSCLTCEIGYLSQISPTTCLSECEDGYYGESSNQTCMKCSDNCLTCQRAQDFCLSCASDKLLEKNVCVESCSQGYYAFVVTATVTSNTTDDNGATVLQNITIETKKCRPCTYPCSTCANTSTTCLSCTSPYILNPSTNKCSMKCSNTQYIDSVNGLCMDCVEPCESCTTSNNCSSCVTVSSSTEVQKYLINGYCLETCPDGMYADTFTKKCKTCLFPCATCDSSRGCLSCMSGYLNVEKKTCDICSVGYFADESTKTCLSCSSSLPNCEQCQSSTVCKVCSDDFYLKDSSSASTPSVSQCITNSVCLNTSAYYVNEQLKRCSRCTLPCGNCSDTSNACTTCITGYLSESRCVFVCPEGTYSESMSNQCLECDSTICKTCETSPTQCTSCFEASTNFTNDVLLPESSTCITEAYCTQNLTTFYLDSSYGYERCLPCQPPCLRCSSISACLSCITGVLYNSTCAYSCPSQFYQSYNSSADITECLPCDTSLCLECQHTSTECISCAIGMLLQENQCVVECSAGFYLNRYILECLPCQSPCEECQSVSYCSTCENSTSHILYFGQCIEQCPEGTYEMLVNASSSDRQCLVCPDECQICQYNSTLSSVVCLKCRIGLYMNSSQEGTCSQECETTEYPDIQTRRCYSCQIPCLTCETATSCSTCIDQYLFYDGECYKSEICSSSIASKSGSQNLNQNSIIFRDPFQNQCLDRCYDPYFGDKNTNLCSEQCTNSYLKVVENGQRNCEDKCPGGFYVDSGNSCSECGANDDFCQSLLTYEIFAKSIFNSLYVKVKFSKPILTSKATSDNIQISVTPIRSLLSEYTTSRRRLLSQAVVSQPYNFTLQQQFGSNDRSLWLQLHTSQSLSQVEIKLSFESYYIFAPSWEPSPETNLQQLNQSVVLKRFDQYSEEQKQAGKSYEGYSIFLSVLLCAVIAIGLVTNSLSLFYGLVDSFQLLFMLLFIMIDYSPNLSHFLHGFRFSHYLFLPQIFSQGGQEEYSNETPGKFGIIVPDADFLNNTGHDFFIIFCFIGLAVVAKLLDFILSGHVKNNKITNEPLENEGMPNDNPGEQQKSQKQALSEEKSPEFSEAVIKSSHVNISPVDIECRLQQQQGRKKSHYRIEEQIIEGRHGALARYSKIFISRLKWNYFNDVCYCLYFYIALFSYSQTYIFSEAAFISNLFAIMGLLFTFGLPIFYTWLLHSNSSQITSDKNPLEPILAYKTFTNSLMVKDSHYALYSVPIKYWKKLLIAILLVYCSEYPTFVLGVILMLACLNIILNILYNPFAIRFEIYIQCVVDGLFVLGILCICAMEMSEEQITAFSSGAGENSSNLMDTSTKITISNVAIWLIILMSVVLVGWNVIRLVAECVKLFCRDEDGQPIDYFANYYQEEVLKMMQESDGKSSLSESLATVEKYKADSHHNPASANPHEDSNVRLNIASSVSHSSHQKGYQQEEHFDDQYSKADGGHRFQGNECRGSDRGRESDSSSNQSDSDSNGESAFGGIYLKKQSDAPPILIKCIKDISDKNSSGSENRSEESDGNNTHTESESDTDQSRKLESYGVNFNTSDGISKLNSQTQKQAQIHTKQYTPNRQKVLSGQNQLSVVHPRQMEDDKENQREFSSQTKNHHLPKMVWQDDSSAPTNKTNGHSGPIQSSASKPNAAISRFKPTYFKAGNLPVANISGDFSDFEEQQRSQKNIQNSDKDNQRDRQSNQRQVPQRLISEQQSKKIQTGGTEPEVNVVYVKSQETQKSEISDRNSDFGKLQNQSEHQNHEKSLEDFEGFKQN